MDKIIPFPQEEEYLDPEEMTVPEREELLEDLNAQLAELDAREPKSNSGDDFEAWAEEHEDLEDAIDEILDILDEKR